MNAPRAARMAWALGLLFCIGIWWVVPWNNFALNNSFISDGYLPEVIVLVLASLVLVVNPLLRRFAPSCVLGRESLVLIVGMMLFAAVLPGNGLMRFFPHALAHDTELINATPAVAAAVRESALPAALFPDPIGYDVPTPVSSQLLDELDPGASIPWRAWGVPFLAWGTVIVGLWALMVGMGLMVYPQWANTERLAFPLLRVYHAMIDAPEPGRLVPESFRNRLFWIGCGAVFCIHGTNGLALFTHGAFPAFPVAWDLSAVFTDGVWQYMPGFLKRSRLYFLFIGLAYFMPVRYSFSVWFTVLFFGIVIMFCQQYVPAFQPMVLYDQGCGALIAMACGVAWLGRRHYAHVFRVACGRGAGGADDPSDALAGRLFLGGCAVVFGWFVWAGAGVGWAALFLVVAVMVMLMVTRIVAETGITYIWIIPLTASRLIGLVPRDWSSVATAFLQQAHYILVNRASAVSAAAVTVLALGLQRASTPARRGRLAWTGLAVLVLGLLVCGAVHLHMGYTLATSFDGVNTPITGRGARQMGIGAVQEVIAGRAGGWDVPQIKMVAWGIALGAALLALCARFPAWPLHPIGLIFVYSSIGLRLFMSLFVGWALKSLLLHFAGARAYRAAMPLFLGLIFGEVFANAFWTLVPIIQLLLGVDPSRIPHMAIFQYT